MVYLVNWDETCWPNRKSPDRLWHRVRDGTLTQTQFQSLVSPIQERVRSLLEQGADYQIGFIEKTPLAKTVRTCRQLLKVEPALWLFVTVEGLEPTNNAAERAIVCDPAIAARPAVLWRRTSFGSQSELRQQGRSLAGSVFVARMLTVVTSLRSQKRNVLEFMTEASRLRRRSHRCCSRAVNRLPLCYRKRLLNKRTIKWLPNCGDHPLSKSSSRSPDFFPSPSHSRSHPRSPPPERLLCDSSDGV